MESRAALVLLLLLISWESVLGHKSTLWEQISQVLRSSGAVSGGDGRNHHTGVAGTEEKLKEIVNFRVHHPTSHSWGDGAARDSGQVDQNKWKSHGLEHGFKNAAQGASDEHYRNLEGQVWKDDKPNWKSEDPSWAKTEKKWKTEEYNSKQPNWKYEQEETKIDEYNGDKGEKWKVIHPHGEQVQPYWREVSGSKEEEPQWILVLPQRTTDEQNWETKVPEWDTKETNQQWKLQEQKQSQESVEEILNSEIPHWKETELKWHTESPLKEEEQKWKIDDSQWNTELKEQEGPQLKNKEEKWKIEESWKNGEKENTEGIIRLEEYWKGDEKNVESWSSKEKDVWRKIYEELERKKLDDKKEYEDKYRGNKSTENSNLSQYQDTWKMLFEEAEKKKNEEEESFEAQKQQFAILAEEEIKRREKEIWRKFYAEIEKKRQDDDKKWEKVGVENLRSDHKELSQYSDTSDQDEIWRRIFAEVQKQKEEESKKRIVWNEEEIKMIYDSWKKLYEVEEKKKIEELESYEKSYEQGKPLTNNKEGDRDTSDEYKIVTNENPLPDSVHSDKVKWNDELTQGEPEYKYYVPSYPQSTVEVFAYPMENVGDPHKQWRAEGENQNEDGTSKTLIPVDTRGPTLSQDVVWKTAEGDVVKEVEIGTSGTSDRERWQGGRTHDGPIVWATPISTHAASTSFQQIVWNRSQK